MTDQPAALRSWKRWVLQRIRTVLIIYVGIMLVMLFLENRLVFPKQSAADYWEEPTTPEIQEVWFTTSSGVRINAWYLPQPGSAEVMVMCHGNGGNISYRSASLLRFREWLGCSVLIFDYPGYGKSEGKPSEQGCYESADAAVKWLADEKKVPSERVILYGESLGGGVATDLASRGNYRALVLLKTFTSLPAVGQKQYWWLPVKWLMHNQFNSLSKIGRVTCPVFISSATADKLVPFGMGEELYAAANAPKEFLALVNEEHNDRVTDEFMERLKAFLATHTSSGE